MSIDSIAYRPHPLLRSGHLQTLMIGVLSGARTAYPTQQIKVKLPDGEALMVHEEPPAWAEVRPLSPQSPIAILLHGLGGDHTSPYLQRIAYELRQRGWRAWRVDLRGSGQGLELAWRPAHAGCSSDLAAVIAQAHLLYPDAPIHVVGFSLSGNILLKLLGEVATGQLHTAFPTEVIRFAMAVAPPVDLEDCASNMDRSSRRIYTSYYLRMLDKQVERRRQRWEQWRAIPREPRVRSIRQFDERFTAPLSGFRDASHYYTTSSSQGMLPEIRTPTTIIADRHDPIVTYSCIARAKLNSLSTRLISTDFGGHMGYFGIDANGRLFRWMEHFVVQELMKQMMVGPGEGSGSQLELLRR